MLKQWFALAAIVGLLSGSAFAQETRATILGSVKDPSGAAVPAVELVVTNLDTNTLTRIKTNEQGLFEVHCLCPASTR